MVICLGQSADLHMAQLVPLPLMSLASVKSRLVLLTQIIPKSRGLHTHTQPFYRSMNFNFVQDYPGELVRKETFTHSHVS